MKKMNGLLFKQMLESGANNLANKYAEVDALNVFPVPDGDTGTNMSLTFTAGVNDALKVNSNKVGDIAKALSKGLLMGARGNSGVITSQIFRGLYQAVKDLEEVSALQLANAFVNGSRVAYKAVMRPVEGTILTVIREASDYTLLYAVDKADLTCEDVLAKLVEEAKISLDHTPELLPVLKEVGVVDSGGAGLLLVFTGFMAGLAGEEIERIEIKGDANQSALMEYEAEGEDAFGYCTEFIIRLDPAKIKAFKEDSLKSELERLPGNSIVVVQDEDIVKVHVHTLKPGNALNAAQRYGEFVKLKIENMQEQHNSIMEANGPVVTTSTVAAAAEPQKEVSIISVAAGDGVKDMFLELHCDHVVSGGQTMNPSAEDIVAAVKKVNAKHVIILPNNSNIVMTAQQAAIILEDEIDVQVIPSKTIPQGLAACIMYNTELSLEENLEEMKEAIANVKTGQVTFAIKDTNIDGVDIYANQYMSLCEKVITACVPNKLDALKETLKGLVDEDSELITLICGEDVTEEEKEEAEAFIEDNFDAEVEIVDGLQPVYSFIVGVE